MKQTKIKKPDIKGFFYKIKNLKKEDIREIIRRRRDRRKEILEKRKNSKWAVKMRPVYKVMNQFSLLFHALLACLINFVIEIMSRHSLTDAWNYMTGSPLVFLYNAFMIFVTFSIVYLVKRRMFVRIIISVLWLVLGICNGTLLLKRVTPFNAQDLKVAADAVTLINSYFSIFELIMIIVGIGAALIWLVAMWRRGGQYEGKMHRVIALFCMIGWFALYSFVSNAAIDKRVVSTYFGNIAFAYEDYGLPYCFMASVFKTGISQPNDYSKATMDRISEHGKITEVKEDTKRRPNIMYVQLESFFDPTEVEFLRFSEDPIPNFRKYAKKYSSGYFKVPSVGAGTANTEFEVLTGMNLRYFGPGEYPYKTVLKDNCVESAATALKALGYGTHALHNNGGNFYSRAKVFNNVGFDSFTSKEFMNILQWTPQGWAKDDILIQHIKDAMDATQGQDFVYTVSVQGHGSYPEEKVILNPKITVTGADTDAQNNAWEYYVNQVYEMDEFVGNLIKSVKARKEPTVIVFYGDHLPTMGLQATDLKNRYLYNTNYLIWDNIKLKKNNENIASFQVMSTLFSRLGIHSGTIFNYQQNRKGTQNYLSDLELLQYDILYGKRYVYGGTNPVDIEPGTMQMGIRTVTLSDITENIDGSYSLYGENFTNYSKVYVNDEKVSSTFLNNTRIELTDTTLEEGDRISVSQVGSSNTIFASSADYLYQGGKLMEQPKTGNSSDSNTEGKK